MTDTVAEQLAALASGPRVRWRRFRRLEIICGACGDTILEVMATQPPVILCKAQGSSSGRGIYHLLEGDPGEMFISSCRCMSEGFSRDGSRPTPQPANGK
jgi:hypothetical protein